MNMGKLLIRVLAYFALFVLLGQIFIGIEGEILAFLLLSLILTLANSIIRPILTLIALPFNIITFGIASVFVNMLTLLIADSIVTQTDVSGFWLMLLVSVLIMGIDALIRFVRLNSNGKYLG